MLNFDFYNPTHISFGEGRIAELDRLIPANARVLVLFGGNSAQRTGTLAEVLPVMLQQRREAKHAKLLQYAERVWGLSSGSEAQRIDAAIVRTRDFFEGLGVKTRLGDYQLGQEVVEPLIAQLEAHGMTRLGELRDVTPAVSRQVLQACL